MQGLRVVSDLSSSNINEEDDFSINYYNLALEQMEFLKVLGNNHFNKKQLAQELRNKKGYFGAT